MRASDEVNVTSRWEKIVNNRLSKAKMNLFLDQANIKTIADDLKALDKEEYHDMQALEESL